jgi:transcriptional regulator with GAF, ATPase, and Fis domain
VRIADKLLAAVGDSRGIQAADRICRACVNLLGVQEAAISLVYDGANIATLGASGGPARTYDELQFTLGEGPCLDSVARRAPVVVTDLADPKEARWPIYGPAMLAHHIHSVSAIPVVVAGQYVGALDLFQASPGRLGQEKMAVAVMAASLAQLPMLDLFDAELQTAITDPDGNAWNDLHAVARAEIAQATGMLIAQLDIGAAEALMRLRAHAYATGATATEVAREIVDRRLRLEPN